MSEPMPMTNCPSPEILAAFHDGHLAPPARRRVIEHMVTCEYCRHGLLATNDTLVGDVSMPVVVNPARRSARTVIAALAVVAAIITFGRFLQRDEEFGVLVSAVDHMESRPIVSRISGGFPFRPYSPKRSAGERPGWNVAQLKLAAVVAELSEEAQNSPSVRGLHKLGLAFLLLHDPNTAVPRLEQALRVETNTADPIAAISKSHNADLLSDLSAAYYQRALYDRSGSDKTAAIEAASAAWRLQQTSEVAWNRALAFEEAAPREDAIAAWETYLRLDSDTHWAAEARTHLQALRTITDVMLWEKAKSRVTAGTITEAETARAARQYPLGARKHIEETVMPAWGAAILARDARSAGHLAIAKAMASGLAANGDLLPADSVQVANIASGVTLTDIAMAHAAYGRGAAAYNKGRYEEAEREFTVAAERFAAARSPFGLFAQFQLARCTYQQNDFARAGRTLADLDERLPHGRYRILAARVAWVRGLAEEQAGQPTHAFRRYEQAFRIFDELQERDLAAAMLTLQGETLQRAGEDEEALDHHLGAVALINQTGSDERRHQVLFEMAYAALEQRRYHTAELFLDRVLVTDRAAQRTTDACVTLIWRSVVHAERNDSIRASADLQDAERYCNAIVSPNARERATANFALASIVASSGAKLPSRDFDELTKTITFFEASNSRLWLPQLFFERAMAYRKAGRLALAEEDLRRGIEEVEAAESKARYTSSVTSNAAKSLYESIITIYVDQGRPFDALAYAERSNRRTTSALFRRNLRDVPSRTRELDALEATRRLQEILPPQTVVANYYQLPDRLLIWTVRSNRVSMHVGEVTAVELERLAAEFREKPQLRSVDAARGAVARRLSQVLFASWIDEVDDDATIVFSGEPTVRILPLSSLIHPSKESYLIEHYAITTSTTLGQLVRSVDADAARSSETHALFVASSSPDPVAYPKLDPIPYTEREIRRAAAVDRDAKVLLGTNAEKRAFLDASPHASFVYFAGHAIANAHAPLFSALIFSSRPDADPADRTLYMHEVSPATFAAARLVMLAACSTGQQLRPNVSFATALIEQQVPSVLSSIWDADDRTSAVLGSHFHRALHKGKSRAAALREAQLALLRSGDLSLSDPVAWAGFQLLGAFSPIYTEEDRNA